MRKVRNGLLMILAAVAAIPSPLVLATPAPPPSVVQSAVAGNQAAKALISKVRTGPGHEKYVELYNPADQPVSLAGWQLVYQTATAKSATLTVFPAGTQLPPQGMIVIAHPAATEGSFDFTFDSKAAVLAQAAGSLQLQRPDGSVADLVGWGKAAAKEGEAVPVRGKTHLWRCHTAGTVVDTDNNANDFSAGDAMTLREIPVCSSSSTPQQPPQQPPRAQDPPAASCQGVKLNEIGARTADQFIEVVNTSSQPVQLAGCRVGTNRQAKLYAFDQQQLQPGQLLSLSVAQMQLTVSKQKGTVYLLDAAGQEIDEAAYTALAEGASWSLIDGTWQQTFAPTPGKANQYKKYSDCHAGMTRDEATGRCRRDTSSGDHTKPCPVGSARSAETGRCRREQPAQQVPCRPGYYRSPETGRCRAQQNAKAKLQMPCREGYYRSEATGRCRSIAGATKAKLQKPCAEDQFRNPKTGRCKKIAADDAVLKQCAEGFERNPKTKRCRKVKLATTSKAAFAPEQVTQTTGHTWGWWVCGGVIALLAAAAVWQWRWELAQCGRRIKQRFISRGK